jgi:transcriptional regulator with XRE-family HTH domain
MSAFRDRQRGRLAAELKRLRIAAELTTYELGQRIGVNQSTVSKIEGNRQRVSLTQVQQWCEATQAPAEQRRELLALAEDVLMKPPTSWRGSSPTESTDFQKETGEIEAASTGINIYQPAVIPGLLQTATYARRVFSSGPDGEPADVAERVLGRMERQRVLYDESKKLRFVIPEAVLRWPFGPVAEHLEQLDRVGEVTRRPNVDILVMPMAPNPVWRLGGFVLYEDDGKPALVHLELLSGPVNIDDPEHLDLYQRVFANLAGSAVGGSEVRVLLDRIASDMRQ